MALSIIIVEYDVECNACKSRESGGDNPMISMIRSGRNMNDRDQISIHLKCLNKGIAKARLSFDREVEEGRQEYLEASGDIEASRLDSEANNNK